MSNPLASAGIFVLFLAVALGGGTLVGVSFPPGDWYAGLAKPWFNPPDWLFGPAWTVLYILVAVAGWRVWRAGERKALGVWAVQMAVNFCWSPVFFGLRRPDLGLFVIVAMLVAILVFIALTWRTNPIASLCFVPYALWVVFAGLLNGAIWWLN